MLKHNRIESNRLRQGHVMQHASEKQSQMNRNGRRLAATGSHAGTGYARAMRA